MEPTPGLGYRWRGGPTSRYLVAVLAVAAALGVRVVVAPLLFDKATFMPFLFAIAATAAVAGAGPGLLATGLSFLAAALFLLPPTNSLWVESPADRLQLLLFGVLAVGITWVCGSLHKARRRAERDWVRLRASEERFRAAVRATSDILWTNDAAGEMVGPQPGWGGFTGQSVDEYQGYGWAAAVHPDDAQPTIDAWERAVAERRRFEFEHRVRRHDGDYRLCSVRAVFLADVHGTIREWVGVHTDITERRAAERALMEADQQKDEFLATLAHELRNPLAPIRNGLQVMRLARGDAGAVEKARGMVERQVGQMSQ